MLLLIVSVVGGGLLDSVQLQSNFLSDVEYTSKNKSSTILSTIPEFEFI
jgi:hypothetical protein